MNAPYGYCPICQKPGKSRTRGIPSYDTCEGGHTYLASASLPYEHAMHSLTPTKFEVTDTASTIPLIVWGGAEQHYATLRVALRNALYRVFGSAGPEVSEVFRKIEAGMSVADATDALEAHLRSRCFHGACGPEDRS